MRGATSAVYCSTSTTSGFNPRAPCGARPGNVTVPIFAVTVSIHASHAGRDLCPADCHPCKPGFNPRAPCGARPAVMTQEETQDAFQSTRPMRGATETAMRRRAHVMFQSTRPMRGATIFVLEISTPPTFQSTRPMRGATVLVSCPESSLRCFNPRAPCGARPRNRLHTVCQGVFQSTRPMRGATRMCLSASMSLRFQSTRPMRGATFVRCVSLRRRTFQSTRPMRGATRRSSCSPLCARFQSTRPMRGATRFFVQIARRLSFQSTRPMRGATFSSIIIISMPTFQSTRPMRGATERLNLLFGRPDVSIHAPHAGRDCHNLSPLIIKRRFNPRAPCGARRCIGYCVSFAFLFQSTRPMRGATDLVTKWLSLSRVSIHAPHAGRDHISFHCRARRGSFNPRAPCGARPRSMRSRIRVHRFNPRAPCGARRGYDNSLDEYRDVSIHAPRVGRDLITTHYYQINTQFQSTRPVWGATLGQLSQSLFLKFQSTRPVWGATYLSLTEFISILVSIHAPRVGRDEDSPTLPRAAREFQSTRPVWGATARGGEGMSDYLVSIHAPRVGRDIIQSLCSAIIDVSIHAPRVGRDKERMLVLPETQVSIHAPRVGRDA